MGKLTAVVVTEVLTTMKNECCFHGFYPSWVNLEIVGHFPSSFVIKNPIPMKVTLLL